MTAFSEYLGLQLIASMDNVTTDTPISQADQVENNITWLGQKEYEITLIVIGCIGVISNGLTLVVMMSSKAMKSHIPNWFLINQTLIDLTGSILTLVNTPTAPFDMPVPPGTAGKVLCAMWMNYYFVWAMFNCSTANLVVITIERYLEIIHPIFHKVHVTKIKVKIVLILVWVVGLVFNAGLAFAPSQVIDNICWRYAIFPSVFARQLTGVVMFSYVLGIPVILMVFCYTKMALSLRSRIHPTHNVSIADKSKAVKIQKIRSNIFKTMVGLALCYFVCWVCDAVWFLMFSFDSPYTKYPSSEVFLVTILAYTNSVINPFVYTSR